MCYSLADNLTILMVVGGYPSSVGYDVELIDLTGQQRTCRKPDDFPGGSKGSVGTYLQDRALVCGGCCYSSECYYYHANGTWTQGPSMTEGRAYSTPGYFNREFWITGGYGQAGLLASTELFNSSSSSFVPFDDLPVPRYHHNLISIEDTKAMLLGGEDKYKETYNFKGGAWQDGPMLSVGRQYSQAGLVTFDNGTQMIVATSGQDQSTSEFLTVGEDEWRLGLELPYYIYYGASVQLENTFLFVGGNNGSTVLDTIWKFDIELKEWVLLDEHLTNKRQYTAAFLVPDEFC